MLDYIPRDALMEHSGWYNLTTGRSIHGVQDFEIAAIPAAAVVPLQDLVQLRDELYENDAILMSGLRMLNQFIAEHEK